MYSNNLILQFEDIRITNEEELAKSKRENILTKVNKTTTSSCPSGYTDNGSKCYIKTNITIIFYIVIYDVVIINIITFPLPFCQKNEISNFFYHKIQIVLTLNCLQHFGMVLVLVSLCS